MGHGIRSTTVESRACPVRATTEELVFGSAMLPNPSSDMARYWPHGVPIPLFDIEPIWNEEHVEEAEVVEEPQEAVEKIVWTKLANGAWLRTRYELPESGFTEAELDAKIAAYYAAPLRKLKGIWYPVNNGRVSRSGTSGSSTD